MKELEPQDRFRLQAAQGWVGLRDFQEAGRELETLSPAARGHPDVLELQWEIHALSGNWDACLETACALVKHAPRYPTGWLHRSASLHALKRTQEAFDELLLTVDLFPREWLIRYNLACYACQLGHHEEACDWLEAAFKLGDTKQIQALASEDPDLRPFWAEIPEV